jgi:predicted nuclease of predicted toxin-antitoxin system
MTFHFLVDEQFPPSLAGFLQKLGYIADHARDVGLGGLDDDALWKFAIANKASIITKDADFVIRQTLDRDGPSVVWLRIGNTRKSVLIAAVQKALPDIVSALQRGDRLIQLIRSGSD